MRQDPATSGHPEAAQELPFNAEIAAVPRTNAILEEDVAGCLTELLVGI